MSFFNKVRSFFGLNVESSKSPIGILDEIIIEEINLKNELMKAQFEFDEISNELELKIKACHKLIEKGSNESALNKDYIVQRLTNITNEYYDNIQVLTDNLKLNRTKRNELETEILQKSIEIVSLLSSDEQSQIQDIIVTWQNTGFVKGEIVDYQLKAISLAIDEVVKVTENIQKKSLIEPEIEKSHQPLAEIKDSKSFNEYNGDYTGHYANVIIKRDNKILFLKRANDKIIAPGQYCLPGGHIDEGETIEQAAIRELKEEANLECSYAYIAGKAKCEDGKWAFYLYGSYSDGEVALLDGESSNAAWMDVDQWLEADLIFDLKDHLIALEIPEERKIDEIPTLTKSDSLELIKAGKGAALGEKRVWGEIEYVKTNHGWIKTKHSDSSKKKEDSEKKQFKHSPDQLSTHAENTSTDQLHKFSSDESKHPHLRDSAKRELERRQTEAGKKDEDSKKKDKKVDTQKHHDKLFDSLESGKFKKKNRIEQDKLVGNAQDHTRGIEKNLTQNFSESEIESLDIYASEKYKEINTYLRNGKLGENKDLDKIIKSIDTAISKNKLKDDIIVYRSLSGNKSLEQDAAFQSTSIDPYAANNFKRDNGKIFKLKIPAGTNYAYLGGGEKELLLPRDLDLNKFIVK